MSSDQVAQIGDAVFRRLETRGTEFTCGLIISLAWNLRTTQGEHYLFPEIDLTENSGDIAIECLDNANVTEWVSEYCSSNCQDVAIFIIVTILVYINGCLKTVAGCDEDCSSSDGEKMSRMQRYDDEAFALYDELFSYACPKLITPSAPSYEEPLVNYNQHS